VAARWFWSGGGVSGELVKPRELTGLMMLPP